MILTSTYHGQTSLSRDLLAAFSALDHATTAGLPDGQLMGAFERLLQRLTVLSALHGPTGPVALLTSLQRATHDSDVVELAASVLEFGEVATLPQASEVQQEIVHFSRIVDIGTLALGDAVAEHALRRLRGSDRLPDSVKVLSELVVVTRSRLASRGRILPRPRLRVTPTAETETETTTLATPATDADYWIAARSARRRIRRQLRYELSALLAYLTPVESALVLWAHVCEQQLPTPVELTVVQADPDTGITAVTWTYRPAGRPADAGQALIRVAEQFPTITHVAGGTMVPLAVGEGIYHVEAESSSPTAKISDPASGKLAATISAAAPTHPTAAPLVRAARRLLAEYSGPELVSIECGHIHLDRDLDRDQDAGVQIGAAALQVLETRQVRAPVVTPMMDDDHVLVRLSPHRYRSFLADALGQRPMHLIAESSPIIRAIVVTLYDQMTHSALAGKIARRGENLFLPLGDGTHCELFEDISGVAPITGCVFFETALLIYRTDPVGFDDYFAHRFRLDRAVHETAADILSEPGSHDAKVTQLRDFYARFAEVTNPRRADPHIAKRVQSVLAAAEPAVAHLNILEDYYEVQQHKVRALLRILDLPLTLVSLHFNVATGRMVLDA